MLALAFLLATVPAQPMDSRIAVARVVLVKSLDDMDHTLTEFAQLIDTRAADADKPRTGITTTSAEDVDAQGLHALTAEIIVKGGPADLAGVRRGDRILRIGKRRIEHETTYVFKIITEGTAGPIDVLVSRGGQEIAVTIDRGPIVCLQTAAAALNRTTWHKLIAVMRSESAAIRTAIDARDTSEVVRYIACKTRIERLYADFKKTSDLLMKDFALNMASCEFTE